MTKGAAAVFNSCHRRRWLLAAPLTSPHRAAAVGHTLKMTWQKRLKYAKVTPAYKAR